MSAAPSKGECTIVKKTLYRQEGERLHFWAFLLYRGGDGKADVLEFWGEVGSESVESQNQEGISEQAAESYLAEQHAQRAGAGFAERKAKEENLVLQLDVAGMGSPEDLETRTYVEDVLSGFLFESGNGHCTGNDIGSGSANLFFAVHNVPAAASLFNQVMAKQGWSAEQYRVACFEAGAPRVLFPPNYQGTFSLL